MTALVASLNPAINPRQNFGSDSEEVRMLPSTHAEANFANRKSLYSCSMKQLCVLLWLQCCPAACICH